CFRDSVMAKRMTPPLSSVFIRARPWLLWAHFRPSSGLNSPIRAQTSPAPNSIALASATSDRAPSRQPITRDMAETRRSSARSPRANGSGNNGRGAGGAGGLLVRRIALMILLAGWAYVLASLIGFDPADPP